MAHGGGGSRINVTYITLRYRVKTVDLSSCTLLWYMVATINVTSVTLRYRVKSVDLSSLH